MTERSAALTRIALGPFASNAAHVRGSAGRFGIGETPLPRVELSKAEPQRLREPEGSTTDSTPQPSVVSEYSSEPMGRQDITGVEPPLPARWIGSSESNGQTPSRAARMKAVTSKDTPNTQTSLSTPEIHDAGQAGREASARPPRVRVAEGPPRTVAPPDFDWTGEAKLPSELAQTRRAESLTSQATEKLVARDPKPESTSSAKVGVELPRPDQSPKLQTNLTIATTEPRTRNLGDLPRSRPEGQLLAPAHASSDVTAPGDQRQRSPEPNATESGTRPSSVGIATTIALTSAQAAKRGGRAHWSQMDTEVAPESGAPGPRSNAAKATGLSFQGGFGFNWTTGIDRNATSAQPAIISRGSREPMADPVRETSPSAALLKNSRHAGSHPIPGTASAPLVTSSVETLNGSQRPGARIVRRPSNQIAGAALILDVAQNEGSKSSDGRTHVGASVQAQQPSVLNPSRRERHGSKIDVMDSDVPAKPRQGQAPMAGARSRGHETRPVWDVGSRNAAPIAPAAPNRSKKQETSHPVRLNSPVQTGVFEPMITHRPGTVRTATSPTEQSASVGRPAPNRVPSLAERSLRPAAPKVPVPAVPRNVVQAPRVSISIGSIEIRAVSAKGPRQRHAAVAARAHSIPSSLGSFV